MSSEEIEEVIFMADIMIEEEIPWMPS